MKLIYTFIFFTASLLAMPHKETGKAKGVTASARRAAQDDALLAQMEAQANTARQELAKKTSEEKKLQVEQDRRNQAMAIEPSFNTDDAFWMLTGYIHDIENRTKETLTFHSVQKIDVPTSGVDHLFWQHVCLQAFPESGTNIGKEAIVFLYNFFQKHAPNRWRHSNTVATLHGLYALHSMDLRKTTVIDLTQLENIRFSHLTRKAIPKGKQYQFENFALPQVRTWLASILANNKHLRGAADEQNADACHTISAQILDSGITEINGQVITPQNRNDVAAHYFTIAAKQHHPEALYNLASMIFNGECNLEAARGIVTGANKEDVAYELFKLAAMNGCAEAMDKLAFQAEKRKESTLAEIGDMHRRAALGGSASAYNNLGHMLEHKEYNYDLYGKLIQTGKRYEIAAKLYREAIKRGDSNACTNLAGMTYEGRYNKNDNSQPFSNGAERYAYAFKLYSKEGSAVSFNMMGRLIHERKYWPKGVDPENFLSAAARYFQKAADLGEVFGLFNVAVTISENLHNRPTASYENEQRAQSLIRQAISKETNPSFTKGYVQAFIRAWGRDPALAAQIEGFINLPQLAAYKAENQLLLKSKASEITDEAFTELTKDLTNTTSGDAILMWNEAAEKLMKSKQKVPALMKGEGTTQQPQRDEDQNTPTSEREKSIQQRMEKRVAELNEIKPLGDVSRRQKTRDGIQVTWEPKARSELETLTRDLGTTFRYERLPLLIEALKDLDCTGMYGIEVLKHEQHNNERIFSGPIGGEHRLWATRTYDDKRNVTEIHIVSLLGHHEHK